MKMTESKFRSEVWNYFEIDSSGEKTKCTFCGAALSYKSNSTKAMWNHLKAKHGYCMATADETINEKYGPRSQRRKHPAVWALHSSASSHHRSEYLPYSNLVPPAEISIKQEPHVTEDSAGSAKNNESLHWQVTVSPTNFDQQQEGTRGDEGGSPLKSSDDPSTSAVISGLLAARDKASAIRPTSPNGSRAPFTMGTVFPIASGVNSITEDEPRTATSPYRSMMGNNTVQGQRSHGGVNYFKSRSSSLFNKKRYNPIVPQVSSTERKQYLLTQEQHAAKLRLIELQMDIATEEHHATMQLINKQTEMYDLRCQLLKSQLQQQQQTNDTKVTKSNGPCSMFEEEDL